MKSRKELKEAYKQQNPKAGIFQVQNDISGKSLIEGSSDILSKWNRHRTELRFGSHRNKSLQSDWKEVGEENFTFSIISELDLENDEILDAKKEVKLLKEMVLEEMNLADGMKY